MLDIKTIILFDLSAGTVLPKLLFGGEASEVLINPKCLRGVIDHPAQLLGRIDNSDAKIDIVVVSSQDCPPLSNDLSKWGFGWRCGRDLDFQWFGIALLEGRVRHAMWISLSSEKPQIQMYGESLQEDYFDLPSILVATSSEIWVCKKRGPSVVRLRDAKMPNYDTSIKVWHGSPVSNMPKLNLASGRLWASFSDAFATCFGASPHSNRGYFQGVDRFSAETPTIYMVIPSGEEHVLDRPCSLYQIIVNTRELCFTGVNGYEFFIHRPAEVLDEKRYTTNLEALESQGVEIICLSTAAYIDKEIAGQCMPYKHALEGFLSIPLDVALRMPCKQWALKFWLIARGIRKITVSDLGWLQDVIERCWLPVIASEVALPEIGYHSVKHLVQTSLMSAWIALQEEGNPIVAALGGLLHDCGRIGDEDGSTHAALGVSVMERTLGRNLRNLLAPEDFQRVRNAIARHASDYHSNDVAIGSCWDADRLRLAWEYGVDSKYFSLPTGLNLARIGKEKCIQEFNVVFGSRFFQE
jgi:hypothetical protein